MRTGSINVHCSINVAEHIGKVKLLLYRFVPVIFVIVADQNEIVQHVYKARR